MALHEIHANDSSYVALQADIVNNTIVGLDSPYAVGKKVYISNATPPVTYIINADYTLTPYVTNLQANDLQIGSVELKDATSDTRSTINADGSLNTSITDITSGSATSGTKSTITDTTKNFITNMLTGTIAEVDIGSTKYFRKVLSNTATSITIDTIAGNPASAILGSGTNGTVTVTSINDGIGGNSLTVQALLGVGNNVAMSVLLTGLNLVVTLGTNGGGTIDNAKNTATLIATAIDALAEFTAVASGTGADVINGSTVINFTGGVAIVAVSSSSQYKIKSTKTINNPVPITSQSSTSSATHTRPNDTNIYATLDVIGESPATNLIFTNAYPIAGAEIIINRVELRIDTASIPVGMSSFRLHLYDSACTAITDNSAFNIPSADRTKYLGYIDIDTPYDFGDTLYIDMKGVNCQVKLGTGSTTLYGMLQTIGAFTPSTSTVKMIKIHTMGV